MDFSAVDNSQFVPETIANIWVIGDVPASVHKHAPGTILHISVISDVLVDGLAEQ